MRALCGRYAFFSPAEAIRQIFRVEHVPELEPRYNVAPTATLKRHARESPALHNVRV